MSLHPLTIARIYGRQIFDSRGTPTVWAGVELTGGVSACAAVPSGASTGQFEAFELRDGDASFGGKGVRRAVEHINGEIHRALHGHRIDNQQLLDRLLCELDGTPNKSQLGANAILAVSLACARAGALAHAMDLFRYIGGISGVTLPVPMMNILNGGAHADNNVDIQEFMILPVGAPTFSAAMEMGLAVYAHLKQLLKQRGLSTAVGDEGGFAPNLQNDEQALELLVDAISAAGYQPRTQVAIGLDIASSEWVTAEGYHLPKQNRTLTAGQMQDWVEHLCRNYPIVSVEDPLGEEAFDDFTKLTERLHGSAQIVGDDLFVTNPSRLARGIREKSGNAILIKPNQIGTLTETINAVRLARSRGFHTIVSHRSGETEDPFIADLAVALNAGQIKTGAPARTDRVCKYNRLLEIEEILGPAALYKGAEAVLAF